MSKSHDFFKIIELFKGSPKVKKANYKELDTATSPWQKQI